MELVKDFLTPNEYSRPQRQLKEVLGVIIHYTANAGASAKANRDFFEARKTGNAGYGSAHYIIDQTGKIIQCIPEFEVAYHVGSSKPDPKSGKIYTDKARQMFGNFATENNSPNNCTIGIELCNIDDAGHFTAKTMTAAVELTADILKRYGLSVRHIATHKEVVGWKDCPLLWVDYPELYDAFKIDVALKMTKGV